MPDLLLIVIIGTALLLALGIFISFMTFTYLKKRLEHREEVEGLAEAYQKEIYKAKIEMQEQTFLSISQEIHDNVGQTLSLVRLNMSVLEEMQIGPALPKVSSSKELLDEAIEDLRNLSKMLNSNYTVQKSLTSLLTSQLDLVQKTGGFHTSFHLDGEEATLDPEKKLIIFRIAQESINNIIKHADASSIEVTLRFLPKKMALIISDDGKGFFLPISTPGETKGKGLGIHNMDFRAKLIGGSLKIFCNPGSGSQVLLDLPFK